MERSRALVTVREVCGSNPADACLDHDLFSDGPNFSGGINARATTHIERTFREALQKPISKVGRVVFGIREDVDDRKRIQSQKPSRKRNVVIL